MVKQWFAKLKEKYRDTPKWTIIDSYILKKFLGSVLFSIALLMTIVIVFDLSENIQRFMNATVSVKEIIIGYYFNFIPYFVNLFLPLFTFISVIWFTSKLSSHNEIISILDNGISFYRLMLPYFVGAMIIVLISLIGANFIVPQANERLINFKYKHFGRQAVSRTYLHIKNNQNSYIFVERWDRRKQEGYHFTYEEFEDAAIKDKIVAQNIRYDKTTAQWIIENYMRRKIVNDEEQLYFGKRLDTVFNILPINFDQDVYAGEIMSYFQLKRFVKEEKTRGSGLLAHYQIEQNRRIANPFGIILMTFLGLSVSSRKNLRGVGVHLFVGMLLAFIFIFLQQISTVFSISGGLSPVLGTWFPGIIFFFITLIMLYIAPK